MSNEPIVDGPALRLPFDVDDLAADPLRTDRMTLRPLEASDADDVWEYQRLPEVLRYIPWPERTRDEGIEHTRKRADMRRLAADEDAVFLAIELGGEPSTDPAADGRDRVVGDVMLRLSSAEHARLEIGWVVHPSFQGRGIATEAARLVLDFAFEELSPHRVQALLDARNGASARLCDRLGMRREALILEDEFNDGEWQDTAIHGILRSEWAAARA
ncbi:GNAT family N-acetyltransferase [Agromyces sp. MMS24-JH15]|uniref:GNAT family N-acetyltransferase n=1 Tax=Agromyces sp. MMS24-JH15 TaxID=3243765 RepID=UPI00374A7B08